MSGYLPDIASWALRGGAGSNQDEGEDGNQQESSADQGNPLTEEEMRARRLARIAGLQQPTEPMDVDSTPKVEQMDVDEEDDRKPPAKPTLPVKAAARPSAKPAAMPVAKPAPKLSKVESVSSSHTTSETQVKKKRAIDPSRKAQRKKELLIKKVLQVSLAGSSTTSDTSCVVLDIDVAEINVQAIAEILPTRLAMTNLPTSHKQTVIPYLGSCYKRSSEELKHMKQSKVKIAPGMEELLDEIKKQTVSYAASSLMVPDLFAMGKDGTMQLAKALISSSTDIASSITQGVGGNATSFYYCLCEELLSQDVSVFEHVIGSVVTILTKALAGLDTVLDTGTEGSGLVLVSALTALCTHKKAALHMSQMSNFLLPASGTVQAQERVSPPVPSPPPGSTREQLQLFRLMQSMRNNAGYRKRSGPGLERETILGLVLRLGCPRDNQAVTGAFPNVMASLDSVEKTAGSLRRQLVVYQGACNQLLRSLVTAGADARKQVMQWFIDALSVNIGATAMRPDYTKVSKPATLINISVVLLKLCEPFMDSEKKSLLINQGFVSSPADHGGVFAVAGDDAVPRLGENETNSSVEYNPKNTFIPQCFFFAARSLHLGFVPLSSFHHNLLRQISHMHYELRQRNADLQSDPGFAHILRMQRANEVTVFLDDMVSATIRFCNLMASFLLRLESPELRTMPEHFVDDICEILQFIARMKPKLLNGHEFRNIFRMVVKLLSPSFADVSDSIVCFVS